MTWYVALVLGSPDSKTYDTRAGQRVRIMRSWLWRAARTCEAEMPYGNEVETLVVDIMISVVVFVTRGVD